MKLKYRVSKVSGTSVYLIRLFFHLSLICRDVLIIWLTDAVIIFSSLLTENSRKFPNFISKSLEKIEEINTKFFGYSKPVQLEIKLNYLQHNSHFQEILENASELVNRYEQSSESFRNFGFRIVDGTFTSAFGHMSHGLEMLKMASELGYFAGDKLLILQSRSANDYYLDHWSQHFIINPMNDRDIKFISRKFGSSVLGMDWIPLKETSGLSGFKLFNFIKREHKNKFGEVSSLVPKTKSREILQAWLRKRGYDSTAWHIVFHVREKGEINGRDYSNADIRTYMDSINYVIEKGGLAILIGENELFPIPEKYGFINYARCQEKSEELNIAILSLCKFLVGTSSGPLTVPPTFGIPILYTNNPRISLSFANKGFCIAKKVFDIEKSTTINFKQQEAFDLGIGLGAYGGRYKYLNNSAVEILEATKDLFNFIENGGDRSTNGQLGVSSEKEGMGMNFAPSFIEMNKHLF